MAITDKMDRLRESCRECRTIAFADLQTGMVFASSTREKVAQESLDELCEIAFQCLAGREAKSIARALSRSDESPPRTVLLNRKDRVFAFLRAPAPAGEAICLVLDAPPKGNQLLDDARRLLEEAVSES